ncbi:hypothetical protein [Providencia sp. PROV223]|uniref:hypothetical protein n=1 Tax=Providencia sp. PROV223 TaxID=2949917 RepID=UPI00234AEEFD|nr:hypothetical protein [Providencia sp. PROV223]
MGYIKNFLQKFKQVSKSETAIGLGITVAKDTLTGGTGIGAVADAGEEAVKWLVNAHREFRQKKETDNLQAFINDTISREKEFGLDFSLENFEKLINKIIQEDNESKSGYYVNLAIKLSNRVDINTNDKNNYISLLSQLSYEELTIISRFYISNKYDIKGYTTKQDQERDIPFNKNKFFPLHLSKLSGLGLLNVGSSFAPDSMATELLIEFSELIFDENELKVGFINEVEKERYDVIINSGINVGDCFDVLEAELKGKGLAVHRCNRLMLDENNLIAGLYVNAIKHDNYYHIGYSKSIEFGKIYDSAKILGFEKISLKNNDFELLFLAEKIVQELRT